MPQLGNDPATGLMNRFGNRFPSFGLGSAPQAGGSGPTKPFLGDTRRLCNDQPGSRALGIIGFHQIIWHMTRISAAARQRCHQDAVGSVNRSQFDRIEQTGHEYPYLRMKSGTPVMAKRQLPQARACREAAIPKRAGGAWPKDLPFQARLRDAATAPLRQNARRTGHRPANLRHSCKAAG